MPNETLADLKTLSEKCPLPVKAEGRCLSIHDGPHRRFNGYVGSHEMAQFLEALVSAYRTGSLIHRSALAEDTARAAEGWEPIETAPRDGTMIGVGGGVAMWNEDKECWVSCMHGSVGRPIQWEVTHWKSLDPATIPAAPALPLDKGAADANR